MAIQTKLVRINSRFRSSGDSSEFTYRFDTKLVDDVYSIELLTASVPRLFGNIYDNINVFSVLVSGSQVLGDVVVPPGQYTASELAATVSSLTGAMFGFELIYDETAKRFVVDSLNDYVFRGRLLPYLGVPHNEDLVVEPGLTTLLNPPNLSGPTQIYLESEFIAAANAVDTAEVKSPYIGLITAIDCSSVPYGFTCSYKKQAEASSSVTFENLISLRSIDISLLDVFGNKLTIPPNIDSDLVFRIYVRITP
jgi:hypothetical protein